MRSGIFSPSWASFLEERSYHAAAPGSHVWLDAGNASVFSLQHWQMNELFLWVTEREYDSMIKSCTLVYLTIIWIAVRHRKGPPSQRSAVAKVRQLLANGYWY